MASEINFTLKDLFSVCEKDKKEKNSSRELQKNFGIGRELARVSKLNDKIFNHRLIQEEINKFSRTLDFIY